jgi:hypothetical protein
VSICNAFVSKNCVLKLVRFAVGMGLSILGVCGIGKRGGLDNNEWGGTCR